MLWADDVSPTNPGPAATVGWLNYGILGLLVFGAILGYVWFKPGVQSLRDERDRAIADRDKAQAQTDAMAESWRTEFLPVLQKLLITSELLLKLAERPPGGEQR